MSPPPFFVFASFMLFFYALCYVVAVVAQRQSAPLCYYLLQVPGNANGPAAPYWIQRWRGGDAAGQREERIGWAN